MIIFAKIIEYQSGSKLNLCSIKGSRHVFKIFPIVAFNPSRRSNKGSFQIQVLQYVAFCYPKIMLLMSLM